MPRQLRTGGRAGGGRYRGPWGDPIPWASATAVVTPTGLALHDRPGVETICLDWTITPAPPPTTTWPIGYESDTGTALLPPLDIPTFTVRAWTPRRG
ncbi:MAG TPA: hypothetical protein ENN19_16995 [Chloroflexi bacterium]|nr:hypothetical protein [Chloroflexota bacterium]